MIGRLMFDAYHLAADACCSYASEMGGSARLMFEYLCGSALVGASRYPRGFGGWCWSSGFVPCHRLRDVGKLPPPALVDFNHQREVFRREYKRKPSDTPSGQSLGTSSTLTSRPISPGQSSLAVPFSDSSVATGITDADLPSRPSLGPFSKKRFTSSWAQKRRAKDDEQGSRGPLGLRLLHPSPEPLIDLIFVHGLRGASVKTWQKGSDPRFFWPQFWLPLEPGLHNVNIHSFGYDSDWRSTKSSILNVHDFGQSLLEEMRNSPYLRDNTNAFVLSRDVSELQGRIRCIFFLATPHRGSDYAATLNNILTVSGIMSSRQYISDLTTGSTSTQLINDEFGKIANDLTIYSFYETLSMKLGITSGIVVGKDSAVLGPGYRNERAQYLNANHGNMCKFESQTDPNYVTFRNALTGAIEDLLKDSYMAKDEESREQMKTLKAYLGISDRPDEQYQSVEGSCQWIDARDDFQDWRDSAVGLLTADTGEAEGDQHNVSLYWIHANPGAGKTHLASHVISDLQEFKLECAYYYFHVGNKTSQSLGDFLRSIAYQMAMSNAAIRERLVALCHDGSAFDMDNARNIWTKVFKKGIFQARVYTPQYWVIDAIDECTKYQEFFTMLKGECPNFPLRIFITSRKVADMQRLYRPLEASMSLTCIEIPQRDSVDDIERYIQSRLENLPIDAAAEKQELGSNVLRRSNASFLWVRLVLDELEQVYSKEIILQVLQGIPEGMVPYYERTTRTMAENKLEKHIAKAVLVWVVASSRKLKISELSHALELDINTVLPSAKSAVEGLCGQLVSVDKSSSGIVDVIHPTVREFLLSPAAGEFSIHKSKAHERIAMTCLQLLSSSELQPPRTWKRRSSSAQKSSEPSPFLDYAVTQFSEHVYSASAETDELLLAIDRFLRTNVLSWIERVAQKGDLYCLIRASKNLKAYLDRRAKYRSPLSGQVKNIDGWSMDLSRLVTKFGAALLQNPSSIYFLIPPLCPSKSAIFQQFGRRPSDGLSVVGFKNEAWDDCIASVSFRDDIPASVSCGDNLIAVGMESGDVELYNHRSCQKERVLDFKYPVDLVHFADTFIAACTTRTISLQDLDGNTLWETRIRFRCILLTSSEDAIIAVSQHGHLLKWDISSGALVEDQAYRYKPYDSDEDHGNLFARAPSLASISPDMESLALGYRGGAVCLWELENNDLVGWARDDEDRLATKLLFNPNPEINLLLVIYTNHDLSLYDTWSGCLINTHKTPNDVGLLSACCSPDGRTLATTDMHGNMQIWDFSSLALLYHVLSPFPSFRILNFTSDGSSVVDVMDSGMRIWSPAALVRKNIEEDNSVSDDATQLAATEGQYETLRTSRITALHAHPSLAVVLAGKYSGEVIAFSTRTGRQTSVLYSHPSAAFVTELAISNKSMVASSDVTGAVQVWRLIPGPLATLKCGTRVMQRPSTAQVKQLCFSPNGEYLLVATTRSDEVYSMTDGSCVGALKFEASERKISRWLTIPGRGSSEQFFLFNDNVLNRYSARDFPARSDGSEVFFRYELTEGSVEAHIDSALVQNDTQTLVLQVHYDLGYVSSSTTFLFDLSRIPSSSASEPLTPLSAVFADCCKHLVGIGEGTRSLVFLHRNSWLSSTDLEGLAEKRHTQHFFVPDEYITTSHEVLPVKTAEDDVVFCLHGELAIVKNGLRFQEARILE
ncbi:hypothetical protein G7046_g2154 [Stylonectria norvegica]|nr:hypothetical protein G7046_g2154 [Stylonectria norvegica]